MEKLIRLYAWKFHLLHTLSLPGNRSFLILPEELRNSKENTPRHNLNFILQGEPGTSWLFLF
jgi:hypothetical protein